MEIGSWNNWNMLKSSKTENQYTATILEKLNMKTSGSGDSNQRINKRFCYIIYPHWTRHILQIEQITNLTLIYIFVKSSRTLYEIFSNKVWERCSINSHRVVDNCPLLTGPLVCNLSLLHEQNFEQQFCTTHNRRCCMDYLTIMRQ